MATHIQLRRGNSTDWATANTILAEGEIGIELDTHKFKIGNGDSAWNDLPYSSSDSHITINGVTGNTFTLAAADVNAIPVSEKGAPNGVAVLDENGRLTQMERPVVVFLGAYEQDPSGDFQYGDYYYNTTTNSFTFWTHLVDPQGAGSDIWIPIADANAVIYSQKAQANGLASLDSAGRVPQEQLPAITITDTHVVGSETEMLAIDGHEGTIAIRYDVSKSFILLQAPASTLSNWQEMLTPPNSVTSVDGRTGAIDLSDRYDAAGSAAQALTDAKAYTDTAVSQGSGGGAGFSGEYDSAATYPTNSLVSYNGVVYANRQQVTGVPPRTGAASTENIASADWSTTGIYNAAPGTETVTFFQNSGGYGYSQAWSNNITSTPTIDGAVSLIQEIDLQQNEKSAFVVGVYDKNYTPLAPAGKMWYFNPSSRFILFHAVYNNMYAGYGVSNDGGSWNLSASFPGNFNTNGSFVHIKLHWTFTSTASTVEVFWAGTSVHTFTLPALTVTEAHSAIGALADQGGSTILARNYSQETGSQSSQWRAMFKAIDAN
jgi:hypothetical protein